MLPAFLQMDQAVSHPTHVFAYGLLSLLEDPFFLSPWRALICLWRLNLYKTHYLQEILPWACWLRESFLCVSSVLMLSKSLSNE